MADTPEDVADRLCNVHGTHNGAGERGLSWCLCRPIEAALQEAEKRGEARGFAKGLEVAAVEASKWSEETLADKLRALAAQALAPKAPPASPEET